MFQGSCCALVTPMDKAGELDYLAFEKLIEWQIQEKTAALVIAGSTGEGSSLSAEEFEKVIKRAVEVVGHRIPVIVGTGTHLTKTTIEKTQHAKSWGADACLIVAPYYIRPTQAGLQLHFENIAKAVNIPILAYNVPSRTGCDMLPETAISLSKISNIIGIKDATGKLDRLTEMRLKCRSDFMILSGDDPTALSLMEKGADGVISITANVAPALMQEMCKAVKVLDFEKARGLDLQLQSLHRMLIAEPNPIPVKWALSYVEKIENSLRAPLTVFSNEFHEKMIQSLQLAGIYSPQTRF